MKNQINLIPLKETNKSPIMTLKKLKYMTWLIENSEYSS